MSTIVALATCLRLWIKGRDKVGKLGRSGRRIANLLIFKWWVDDLLATLGMLVMIEQQCVLWARSIYEPPTLAIFYTVSLSTQTIKW
jgi:hypothetical protein